jgi:hypothetical protein
MHLRRRFVLPCLLVSFAAPVATAAAQEPQTERTIAAGVKAGGVDVGGQTIESAATTIELALGQRFNRPIDVVSAGRSFRLQPVDAGLKLDALTTAKRAYYAGRDKGPA